MTEPQDPQSPPNYPTYPGQTSSTPAPPEHNPYPAAPTGSLPPQSYPQPGQTTGPGPRPGGVTAAAWITIILSVITALSAFAAFAASGQAAEEFLKLIEDNPDEFNMETSELPTLDELQGVVTGLGAVLLVVAIIGLVLGLLVLKRQSWARILLLVTSALTAICAILPSFLGIGLLWLVGSVVVFILLLSSKASAWFKAAKV